MVSTFVIMGFMDLKEGLWATGTASLLLAAVNGLLLAP